MKCEANCIIAGITSILFFDGDLKFGGEIRAGIGLASRPIPSLFQRSVQLLTPHLFLFFSNFQ